MNLKSQLPAARDYLFAELTRANKLVCSLIDRAEQLEAQNHALGEELDRVSEVLTAAQRKKLGYPED